MASRPTGTVADGCDLSQRANAAALAAATVPTGGRCKFVVRYLSPDTPLHPTKQLTFNECSALRAARLAICVVWETSTSRAEADFAAGAADARAADAVRHSLAMPPDMVIHFAIDEDATGAEVEQYFRGVASVLGAHRTGAYGGIHPLAYLWGLGLIRYPWQTFAWSAGAILAQATAYQWHNDATLGGQNVDLDAALAADYGQWEPDGTSSDRGVVAGMTMTDADLDAIAARVWAKDLKGAGGPPTDPAAPIPAGVMVRASFYRDGYSANVGIPALLASASNEADALAAMKTELDGLPAAVVAALPPSSGGGYTPEQVAAAVMEALAGSTIQTTITAAAPAV